MFTATQVVVTLCGWDNLSLLLMLDLRKVTHLCPTFLSKEGQCHCPTGVLLRITGGDLLCQC